ncbi:dehydration-induced 19-like protein, partial [Genlisea aurea]
TMDATSWAARLFSASKRYQPRSSDVDAEGLMGFEDAEMDDEAAQEYTCPFCSEFFDIVGLCCHIDDQHPVEAINGVCPVCAMRVGVDMVAHITLQHGNIVK